MGLLEGLEGISGGAVGREHNPDLFAPFLEKNLFPQEVPILFGEEPEKITWIIEIME